MRTTLRATQLREAFEYILRLLSVSRFSLSGSHPNVLAERKWPMHTIIPVMLADGGHAMKSFGVTGGHFQPAGQLQVLPDIADYGMSVRQAIGFSRMFARGGSLELCAQKKKAIKL